MKWVDFVAVSYVFASLDGVTAAFVSQSIYSFTDCCRLSCLYPSRKRNRQNIFMYHCGGLQSIAETPSYMKNTIASDTTTIGNLVVPSIGVGTISWSSKSREFNLNASTYFCANTFSV